MSELPPAPEESAIDTNYEVGQHNIDGKLGPFGFDIHNPVFVISGASIIGFVAYALIFRTQATEFFGWLRPALTSNFDWFFVITANIIVLFSLVLIFTPFGRVRIGGKDAVPDFTYIGWFAMLFAAGMGIGLMFFGVVEPVYHMAVSQPLGTPSPFGPDGTIVPEHVAEAKRMGLAGTIYHWALHPWGIYGIVGLSLALFAYNKGLPLTARSVFYPIFGDRIWGWPGHVVDTLAVFATLFGLATSLGFGAQQANAGLSHIYGVPDGLTVQVILIIVITAIATFSVVRGLDGGVKILSEINMAMAALLLLFVLLAGPTLTILRDFAAGLGAYVVNLPALSNPIGRTDDDYLNGWTTFYWAWWISWSPFVGMFIARVSRGRTVREFLISVLVVPSIVCVLWMAVFGGVAIEQVLADPVGSSVKAEVIDAYRPELALFAMLENLPLPAISSTLGIVLVAVFFITSSDSGSMVIDTITAGGKVDSPMPQRVFWCTFEGLVAMVLLLGGGLAALQAMVISTGLPFAVILLGMCWCLWIGLRTEPR